MKNDLYNQPPPEVVDGRQWLTNVSKSAADDVVMGYVSRGIKVELGNPRPTDVYTVERLIVSGIVGLYRVVG